MDFSKDMDMDFRHAEKKAKRIWKSLREDQIEIRFCTSPLGLMLVAGTVCVLLCASKWIGRLEQKCAVKKEAKRLSKPDSAGA